MQKCTYEMLMSLIYTQEVDAMSVMKGDDISSLAIAVKAGRVVKKKFIYVDKYGNEMVVSKSDWIIKDGDDLEIVPDQRNNPSGYEKAFELDLSGGEISKEITKKRKVEFFLKIKRLIDKVRFWCIKRSS